MADLEAGKAGEQAGKESPDKDSQWETTTQCVPAGPLDNKIGSIFPLLHHPLVVNSVHARVVALFATIICAICITFRNKVAIHYITAGLAADYLARVAYGGRMSPMGITADLISMWFKPIWADGAPKQFAVIVGCGFATVAAVLFFAAESPIAAAIVIGMLMGASALNAFIDFCLGCWMFDMARVYGIVPGEAKDEPYPVHADMKAMEDWTTAREQHTPAEKVMHAEGVKEGRSATALRYKVKSDEYTRDDFHPIKHCHVYFFAAPMGIAGWAFVWIASETVLGTSRGLWVAFSICAGVAFSLFAILYVLKAVLYPSKVCKEWHHPVKSNFFSCIPITLLIFSVIALQESNKLCQILFWAAAPVQLALAVVFTARWIQVPFYVEHIDASWLMPPLGGFVAAYVAPLVPGHEGRVFQFREAGWLWFSYALLLWVVLLAVVMLRLVTRHKPEVRLRSGLLVFVAAPAMAGLAYISLTSTAGRNAFDNDFPRFAFYVSWVWFFVFGYLGLVGFFRGGKFDMAAWGYPFPLATLAALSILYHGHHRTDMTKVLAYASFVAAGIATYMCTFHSISYLLNRKMFTPDDKWSPLSFMKLVHRSTEGGLSKLSELADAVVESSNSVNVRALEKHFRLVVLLHNEHRSHEDDVIYKAFNEYFPGVVDFATEDHKGSNDGTDAIFGKIETLKVATAAMKKDIADELKVAVTEFDQHYRAHMKMEEEHLNPIGRKHMSLPLHIELVRKCFDSTPSKSWEKLIPFIVESCELPSHRVRFLRCLLWAMPERSQLIGKWLFEGVNDKYLYKRLAVEVPEIVPRGMPGWVRYW